MKNNACTEVTEQIGNGGRFRVGRDGLQPGFGRNLIAQDASQVVVRPVRLLGFAAVIFLMGVALLTPLCGWGQADGQFSVRRQSEQQQQAGQLEDDQEPDEPPEQTSQFPQQYNENRPSEPGEPPDQTSQFLPQYNENRPSEPGSEMQPPGPFREYENAPAAAPPQYPAHRNEDYPNQQQDGRRQAAQQGGVSQGPEPRVKAQPGKQIRGAGGSQQRRQRPMDQPQLQPPPLIPPPKLVNNPYPDNPALRDLYRQYRIQGSKTIERFGASLFRNGSGKPDKLPLDIPVGPDYVLGPGDTVMIDVSGGAPQRLRSIVDPEGRISLPGGGTLLVTGMTMESAARATEQVLVRRFYDAKVDLSLTRLRTIRVYVVGDVLRPGAYDISALSTALNGLYAAGGPTNRGSLRVVRHYRGAELISTIDLYDLLLRGVRSDVQRLQSGDSILVPPAGMQVVVDGAVRRPAMYELRAEQSLDQVLELAGGLLPEASLWQISIDRVEAHERHVTHTAPVPQNADAAAVKVALAACPIQDGDRIYVAPISPFTEQSVYLEGHAFRTGKYAFHPGMKVTDLVRSYSDLLPEPRKQAEIIRLDGPDLRPVAIKFDIVDVLDGKEPAPEVRPFDVIRVYGRYAVDPPRVRIAGEVLRPGVYPLAVNMRVSDLIQLAGGFRRSAYREDALLASYQIRDGKSVVTTQKQVNLSNLASGDTSADLLLKPGDQVSIRQMAGWKDIGASVTLTGEVQFPGAYGIEPGEHLSSVIRRAGGFLPEAYPRAAVFERRQVRELNEQTKLMIIRKIETTPNPAKWSESSGANPALAFEEQKRGMLIALRNQPTSGRLVIGISADIAAWENTPFDLQLRAGDSLIIPKQPGFVMVAGQVNNNTALIYTPGKSVGAYLKQAGGPTRSADAKELYVIQASGRVIGRDSGRMFRSIQDVLVGPGDTIVVPDRIRVESQTWKNVLNTAQIISSLAITAAVVKTF
jgi:protein involved in polysaccharide export with SLBB domain